MTRVGTVAGVTAGFALLGFSLAGIAAIDRRLALDTAGRMRHDAATVVAGKREVCRFATAVPSRESAPDA